MEDDIYLDSEPIDSTNDPHIARLPEAQRVNALRLGLAITYDDMYGWRMWTPSLATLLWTHLTIPGTRVVGWGIVNYDLVIIRSSTTVHTAPRVLDLSAQIEAASRRRYKLDIIARTNLGRSKSVDTQTVVGWLRAGDEASMIKATEHCHSNVQVVMDLLNMLQRGQPLVLPGRLETDERGWARTREATLRVYFTPEGEWLRCEDLRGKLVTERGMDQT